MRLATPASSIVFSRQCLVLGKMSEKRAGIGPRFKLGGCKPLMQLLHGACMFDAGAKASHYWNGNMLADEENF